NRRTFSTVSMQMGTVPGTGLERPTGERSAPSWCGPRTGPPCRTRPPLQRVSATHAGDELERRRLEVVAVAPHPADALTELRQLLQGTLGVEALPRREADVGGGVVFVAHEPERRRAGHVARPGDDLRPRLDEGRLLARLHPPVAPRVGL